MNLKIVLGQINRSLFYLVEELTLSIISSIVSKKKIKAKFYSFKSKSKNYDETNNINILKKKFVKSQVYF